MIGLGPHKDTDPKIVIEMDDEIDLEQMRIWLQKNCIDRWNYDTMWKWYDDGPDLLIQFLFESEEDAIMFALKWV